MVGKGIMALRRKSWQLITLNRFFQKNKERSSVKVDDGGKQHSSDTKNELQRLAQDARSSGKYKSGYASHIFSNGDEYDGEWRDGSMTGKGVFRYANGNEYTGFWTDNKRNGQGTFLNDETGTKYEGQWVHDKRHGRGKFTDRDGNCYDGEWLNNDMNGQGVYRFVNGDLYEGIFADNDFNGDGRFTYGNGDYYEGEWLEGKCHGYGKFVYPELDHTYEGEWINDRKTGKGKYTAPDYIYDGDWKEDAMSGYGDYAYPNGDKYVGNWVDNEEHGNGVFYHNDGSRYDGAFQHGKRFGFGTFFATDGSKYEGEWEDNVKTGTGTYTYPNGDKYNGGWAEDQMHGNGIYLYKSGKQYKVEFENGKCIHKEKLPDKAQEVPKEVAPPKPAYIPKPPKEDERPVKKEPTEDDRAREFVQRCRDDAVQLMAAIENPAAADAAMVAQCRADMQQTLKQLGAKGVNATTKQDLSEVADHLNELLQMFDDAQASANNRKLPKIGNRDMEDTKKRDAEAKQKALEAEKERQSMQRRMEELRMKKKEKEEMDELNKKLEEQKRANQQILYKLEKDTEDTEVHQKVRQQKEEIEKLKREAEMFQKQQPQVELLRKQIEAERAERESAAQRKVDAKKKIHLENAETQKNAGIAAEKASQEDRAKREVDAARRQMKNDLGGRVQEFKVKWEREHKAADDKEALAERIKADWERKLEDMQVILDKLNAGPDKQMANAEQLAELKKMRETFQKEQQNRRKLYNELADLKGSVRIFVRVRDNSDGKESIAVPADEMIAVIQDKKKISFEFERIFAPGCSLDDVYNNAGAICAGVLEGNHCGIIAYGSTGSGKSYCMIESPESIAPRAFTDLFKMIEERNERDEISVELGLFEVDGEKMRCLQSNNRSLSVDGSEIAGLTLTSVSSARECIQLINKAKEGVSDSTSFIIQGVFNVRSLQTAGQSFRSKLVLADLAGGEKNDPGLANLQEVYCALSKKSKSVPYGNNTLTNAMKDALGGKSLILANVSSAFADQGNSMNTLLFCCNAKGEPYNPAKKK